MEREYLVDDGDEPLNLFHYSPRQAAEFYMETEFDMEVEDLPDLVTVTVEDVETEERTEFTFELGGGEYSVISS